MALKNIILLYESREAFIKLFNNYSLIVPKGQIRSKTRRATENIDS